ncbi:E1 protein [Talpa europaea papillomavirus 1]|uniref:Replication protein E1 n=1 Tax=Talpa europaea papillomavirus 1 TaxID=1338506 RepID=R9RZ81_9PAPI|nr:E1 protein [Talpa europaea papillomavirus 1]AGM75114.1 E1 protein [Talpa europaea papillomavirus 1]
MADKGNKVLDDWVITEAECSDLEDEWEELDSEDVVEDLIDDGSVCEGNSRELFQQQELTNSDYQLQLLKRKFIHSPESKAIQSLSPRLSAISISPRSTKKAKKQLFSQSEPSSQNDSGVEESLNNEADGSFEQGTHTQVDENGNDTVEDIVNQLLIDSNRKSTMLCKFKECMGVSFAELTRPFKSDKTCSQEWVVVIFGVFERLFEGSKTLLQVHCNFYMLSRLFINDDSTMTVLLVSLKAQKSRETLHKMIKSIFFCRDEQLMSEPPRVRSVPAALFWYKRSFTGLAFVHGAMPVWVTRQTELDHQMAAVKAFELSAMIQWAYDNDLTEESQIAYQYALLGDVDENAMAFLATNSQAKHVKDCAQMVRYYKRAEMQKMTMSEWIYKRCKLVEEEGNWKEIVNFLRSQNIEFIRFLSALKTLLQGVPKKNCLVLYGPPNTGKSMFAMSLLKFLGGKVISFVNSKSQFWLQPLADAKIGLLDDATGPCWDYFDIYLRNALDGNPVSLDCKHRAPMQLKFPPLLITTNINVAEDNKLAFLHSRLQSFTFRTIFEFDEDGSPAYQLNDQNWKSFFTRFWSTLELSDQEDEGDDGDPETTLRLSSKRVAESL